MPCLETYANTNTKHVNTQPKPRLNNYTDCIMYVEENNKGRGFSKTEMSFVIHLNDPFKLFTERQFYLVCKI